MSEQLKTEIPKARAMTNGEYKQFKAAGRDPLYFGGDGNYMQEIVKSREWVIDNIYGGNFSDDVSRGDLMQLAQTTINLTHGFEKEIKN